MRPSYDCATHRECNVANLHRPLSPHPWNHRCLYTTRKPVQSYVLCQPCFTCLMQNQLQAGSCSPRLQ